MNLYAFPFYPAIEQQSRYTSNCLAFADPVLYTATNKLLPFVIRKPSDGKLIDCVNVYKANGQFHERILGNQFPYSFFTAGGFDYIIHFDAVLPIVLPCGDYYIEIQGYYSEVFRVLNSLEGLVEVKWKNKTNISNILYQTGFTQRLLLNTVVSEPAYEYEIEGGENEANEVIPSMHTVKKVMKLETDLLPPFLMDALAAVKIHDQVTIAGIKAKEIDFKPDWPEEASGCLGLATIEFLASDPVTMMLCTENLVLVQADVAGYDPQAWVCGSTDPTPQWQPTGASMCEEI